MAPWLSIEDKLLIPISLSSNNHRRHPCIAACVWLQPAVWNRKGHSPKSLILSSQTICLPQLATLNSPRAKVRDDHVPAVGSRSPDLSPHRDPTASAQWGWATYLFSDLVWSATSRQCCPRGLRACLSLSTSSPQEVSLSKCFFPQCYFF